MKRIFLIGLMALITSPALAQTQDDVLTAAMLPGWQMNNGHYMAGLHLNLAPHWKTYWRAPGETGIPPRFDWSGSQNVQSVALHWPSPQVITLSGLQSIVYLDDLVLPVEVTPKDPNKPVSLRLYMQLGICDQICMPAELSLSAELATSNTQDTLIAAALKKGPISQHAAGLDKIHCDVTPINDGLHIAAQIVIPQQGTPETVVFETRDQTVWVAEASSNRDGKVLRSATDMVAQAGTPFALDRSGVTVTVIGQDRSVEIKGCPAP
jgi:DsbC/DsbD-like thiol-disulfide interchange protein